MAAQLAAAEPWQASSAERQWRTTGSAWHLGSLVHESLPCPVGAGSSDASLALLSLPELLPFSGGGGESGRGGSCTGTGTCRRRRWTLSKLTRAGEAVQTSSPAPPSQFLPSHTRKAGVLGGMGRMPLVLGRAPRSGPLPRMPSGESRAEQSTLASPGRQETRMVEEGPGPSASGAQRRSLEISGALPVPLGVCE